MTAMAWQPNLSWITDELAIGGSFPQERAAELALTHDVRGVIDLRVEACDDERLLRSHGMTFLHLPTEDVCAVSLAMLRDGVRFANRHLDRAERVLIHCQHGVGRSSTLALCVLVSRGLAPLEALALAKRRRAALSPSPAQYEAWARWLREQRGVAWAVPAFAEFGLIAYRPGPR